MNKFFSWIAMFFILWAVGSLVSVVLELGMAMAGFPISSHVTGLIILLIITFGLIWYGTRKQTKKTNWRKLK